MKFNVWLSQYYEDLSVSRHEFFESVSQDVDNFVSKKTWYEVTDSDYDNIPRLSVVHKIQVALRSIYFAQPSVEMFNRHTTTLACDFCSIYKLENLIYTAFYSRCTHKLFGTFYPTRYAFFDVKCRVCKDCLLSTSKVPPQLPGDIVENAVHLNIPLNIVSNFLAIDATNLGRLVKQRSNQKIEVIITDHKIKVLNEDVTKNLLLLNQILNPCTLDSEYSLKDLLRFNKKIIKSVKCEICEENDSYRSIFLSEYFKFARGKYLAEKHSHFSILLNVCTECLEFIDDPLETFDTKGSNTSSIHRTVSSYTLDTLKYNLTTSTEEKTELLQILKDIRKKARDRGSESIIFSSPDDYEIVTRLFAQELFMSGLITRPERYSIESVLVYDRENERNPHADAYSCDKRGFDKDILDFAVVGSDILLLSPLPQSSMRWLNFLKKMLMRRGCRAIYHVGGISRLYEPTEWIYCVLFIPNLLKTHDIRNFGIYEVSTIRPSIDNKKLFTNIARAVTIHEPFHRPCLSIFHKRKTFKLAKELHKNSTMSLDNQPEYIINIIKLEQSLALLYVFEVRTSHIWAKIIKLYGPEPSGIVNNRLDDLFFKVNPFQILNKSQQIFMVRLSSHTRRRPLPSVHDRDYITPNIACQFVEPYHVEKEIQQVKRTFVDNLYSDFAAFARTPVKKKNFNDESIDEYTALFNRLMEYRKKYMLYRKASSHSSYGKNVYLKVSCSGKLHLATHLFLQFYMDTLAPLGCTSIAWVLNQQDNSQIRKEWSYFREQFKAKFQTRLELSFSARDTVIDNEFSLFLYDVERKEFII